MGCGGGVGVKALLEVGFLQPRAGRGQAEHDCQQLPSLPVLCIYYIFQLRAINSNSTSAEKKENGTTDNQEGRLQHRSRPSCDEETPRTGEGLTFLSFNVGPYDSNVVKIPHKVTLSEVCVLAVFLPHLSMWSMLLWSCTPGENANEGGEMLLRTLLSLVLCLIRWNVTL